MNASCVACEGAWPSPDHWIADGAISSAYLFDDQFFPGWTVLVLKRHVTELFHLSTEERHRVIDDVSAVAEALMAVFHPVKMNYELLGNQLPHMHWHVIPRLADDPAPRDPVWTVVHAKSVLDSAGRLERINAIRIQLQRRFAV
jgi:diadenosine tetraphosphate (Ap4A) HIT family hydrolase